MPTKLRRLKQEAQEAAEFQGHILGRWEDLGIVWHGPAARATCANKGCTAWVQVETKPAPNSIDIGGPAVAVGCPYVEDIAPEQLSEEEDRLYMRSTAHTMREH